MAAMGYGMLVCEFHLFVLGMTRDTLDRGHIEFGHGCRRVKDNHEVVHFFYKVIGNLNGFALISLNKMVIRIRSNFFLSGRL